jgi:hypothetical protein
MVARPGAAEAPLPLAYPSSLYPQIILPQIAQGAISQSRDLMQGRCMQVPGSVGEASTSGMTGGKWWAMQGSNLRPHPCEGCALPLS